VAFSFVSYTTVALRHPNWWSAPEPLLILRDGLRLVEQREAEDAGKLKALRATARVGVGALDRGDFKEFGNIEELQTYLNYLFKKVISRTAE
jgi:antitoxin ParD1/3/4